MNERTNDMKTVDEILKQMTDRYVKRTLFGDGLTPIEKEVNEDDRQVINFLEEYKKLKVLEPLADVLNKEYLRGKAEADLEYKLHREKYGDRYEEGKRDMLHIIHEIHKDKCGSINCEDCYCHRYEHCTDIYVQDELDKLFKEYGMTTFEGGFEDD